MLLTDTAIDTGKVAIKGADQEIKGEKTKVQRERCRDKDTEIKVQR